MNEKIVKGCIIIGGILLLAAVALRLTMFPLAVAGRALKPLSFLVLANTAFLVALLFKK